MELKEAIKLLKEGVVNSVGNEITGMAESPKEYTQAVNKALQALENSISKDKIIEKIEERKKQLEETSKRREKAKEQEEQAVLWCIEIRLDERIKTYEELLKGE